MLEDTLNLKDIKIYDTFDERRVLNKEETTIASQKQENIKEAFKDWIFRDPERRQKIVETYNELFNSVRPREYEGSHLTFPGMTPDIELKPHQKNAIAHILYGNNTLLAGVGVSKTFEMIAAAMESKRLGLCPESLFVVPNHLVEQWASDFLRLYPGANILPTGKKILNRQTGKNSVPELLPEIMMQLLSDIASLKKYLFPMNDKKIQSYSRLMRSKKDFVK